MLEFMSVCNLRDLLKNKFFKTLLNSIIYRLFYDQLSNNFLNCGVTETGLCHFHKVVATILKQYFPKIKPHVVNCRDYWKLYNTKLRVKLDNKIIHDTNNSEYQNFFNWFIEILKKHNTIKQKYLMVKDLLKAIMESSSSSHKLLCKKT